jgi:hypothetical protein
MAFIPRTASFSGSIRLGAPVECAFLLFSPAGEKKWVPGWDPEFLHPPGEEWKEGMIFRTEEASGTAVWVVGVLNTVGHRVRYHRVEPGHLIAQIEVSCDPVPGGGSEVSVVYSYTGLSDKGNDAISAMTAGEYEAKMARWTLWLEKCLATDRAG